MREMRAELLKDPDLMEAATRLLALLVDSGFVIRRKRLRTDYSPRQGWKRAFVREVSTWSTNVHPLIHMDVVPGITPEQMRNRVYSFVHYYNRRNPENPLPRVSISILANGTLDITAYNGSDDGAVEESNREQTSQVPVARVSSGYSIPVGVGVEATPSPESFDREAADDPAEVARWSGTDPDPA